ncbi:hypothetical protein [Ancylobacter sp. FA202]|uniref:hypothetical protein n=1 Tax=Ancylobacter sp. FA202 TaxID=1111106 RepID=UPI0012DDC849|nr:hypothetical protein [Ancylobacter sp. FA202]
MFPLAIVRIVSLVLTGSLPFLTATNTAMADSRDCDAVTSRATLDYDPYLLVSIAKNMNDRVCTFYVSLPPNMNGTPLQRAAFDLGMLITADRSDADRLRDNVNLFVRNYISALAINSRNDREVAAIKSISSDDRMVMGNCIVEQLFKGGVYAKYNDFIECGFVPGARSFAITINKQQIAITTLIPYRMSA